MGRKLISLFTGAGGLDLGFEAAGFDTAVAVEMDDEAVTTLEANREWPVIARDIHRLPSDELLATAGLREGEADVLIGGPPCQPFSKSGYWSSGDALRLDDPRSDTLAAYLRVLRDTLPRTFLLENVPGLAFRGKAEGLDLILRTVESINRSRGVDYRIAWAKLNAAEHGVPQVRERVFVIGSREGLPFEFPAPTHAADPSADFDSGDLGSGDFDSGGADPRFGSGDDPGSELLPFTTAWDAIGDLARSRNPGLEPSGKWAGLLPSIPEGHNYLWHTDRGGGLPLFGWRRRYWSFLLKLAKDRPSWTLQAQPGPAIGPFHWNNRRLSARELCRLQTFPDDFEIVGPLRSAQKQVGNAVPSALAEVLARAIRRQLLGEADLDPLPTLVPEARPKCPGPRRPEPVPERYRHLVGRHEAHPGTGRGYAAVQRDPEKRAASS